MDWAWHQSLGQRPLPTTELLNNLMAVGTDVEAHTVVFRGRQQSMAKDLLTSCDLQINSRAVRVELH